MLRDTFLFSSNLHGRSSKADTLHQRVTNAFPLTFWIDENRRPMSQISIMTNRKGRVTTLDQARVVTFDMVGIGPVHRQVILPAWRGENDVSRGLCQTELCMDE